MKNSTRLQGFTLIELMVVVVIIAALAGMVLPRVLPASTQAKIGISKGDMAGISVGLKLFKLDNDRFPTTEEGLNALMEKPASARNWKGPYLERSAKDPWGQPYKYQQPGTHNTFSFDIWSMGPDETSNQDIIGNWE